MQGPPSGKLSCKIVLATSNCLTELLVGCFTWLGWPPLNNLRTLFRPDRRQFVFSFSAPAGWDWAVLSSEQFQFIYKVLCKIVGRSLAVCVLQPGNVWYQFAPAERSRESWAVTRWRSLQLEIFHIRSGSCYLHTSLCTLSHPQSNYWDKGCHQAAIIVLFCFEIFLGIDRHRPAMCYISTERPGLPGVTRANPTATTQRAIIWTEGRCEVWGRVRQQHPLSPHVFGNPNWPCLSTVSREDYKQEDGDTNTGLHRLPTNTRDIILLDIHYLRLSDKYSEHRGDSALSISPDICQSAHH